MITSCHHATLEDRAAKMAADYTERYCPTPPENYVVTDSVTFDRDTKTFNYYYRFTDKADNIETINKSKKLLDKELTEGLRENTTMKVYKEASYNFNYVFRSNKTGNILYSKHLSAKDYNVKQSQKRQRR
jgi:hypothetical protein